MILLVDNYDSFTWNLVHYLGGLGADVDVRRNARGRQVHSTIVRDDADELDLVLIRAPRIARVGTAVEVLATQGGEPVLVRQGRVVGATFHPELTSDARIHALALDGAQWIRTSTSGAPRGSSSSSGPSTDDTIMSGVDRAM